MDTPIIALAGGVGGAKLISGLTKTLDTKDLAIIVNTADDEEFYGLRVSPDIDTMTYTLAGLANNVTGWGRSSETYHTLQCLQDYGLDTWFQLGDKDMATHIYRTDLLNKGRSLSEVTTQITKALGVKYVIAPMTDDIIKTKIVTENSVLSFQDYFVRNQGKIAIKELLFEGSEHASPSPIFSKSLENANGLIICPSNPFLSIAPILSIPGVRSSLEEFTGLRVAISPIIGQQAVRGPAAKILEDFGEDVSCFGVAKQYQNICDIFVIDESDKKYARDIEHLSLQVHTANILMTTDADKENLAREICDLIEV